MAERFDEQMAQMKSEINQSQLSDHRAEKDIHQIVSDVFRLDELSWGIIRICIAQLLFGCMNVYAWRKRQTNPDWCRRCPRPVHFRGVLRDPIANIKDDRYFQKKF